MKQHYLRRSYHEEICAVPFLHQRLSSNMGSRSALLETEYR